MQTKTEPRQTEMRTTTTFNFSFAPSQLGKLLEL